MTTIHAYTTDQRLQDAPHKDLRRARAAAINLVPPSTGAAKAIGLVIPELNGKLDGFAVRAPVPTGSVVDLTIEAERETTRRGDQRGDEGRRPTRAPSTGILRYTEEPIVSSDIVKRPALLDLRLAADRGHRRRPGQGRRLVRQRVGLLEPLRRPRPEGAGACARLTISTSRASASSSAWTSTSRSTRTAAITDDARIRAALPTLKAARAGAQARALLAHLGRPKGREPELSLKPAAERLAELLGVDVMLAPDVSTSVGAERRRRDGRERALLRRARRRTTPSSPSATRSSPTSTSTTRSAPPTARTPRTEGVAHLLPSAARAGCSSARSRRSPASSRTRKRPLVAVVGGAKVTDKIGVLEAFLETRRHGPDRRRDVLPVLQGPGPRRRRLAVRGGGRRARASQAARQRPQARAADRPRRRPRVQRRHRGPGARRRRRPRRLDGPRHRPRDRGALRASDRRPPARCSGTGRWARSSSSRSRPGRRRSPRRWPRREATTVVGGGDSAAALAAVRARRPRRPPLDRRRRVARADRGQGAARAWRPCHESASRSSPATGR